MMFWQTVEFCCLYFFVAPAVFFFLIKFVDDKIVERLKEWGRKKIVFVFLIERRLRMVQIGTSMMYGRGSIATIRLNTRTQH